MDVTVSGRITTEATSSDEDILIKSEDSEDVTFSARSSNIEDILDITTSIDIENNTSQELLELRYARSELINLMKESRKKSLTSKIKAEFCRTLNGVFLVFLAMCSATMFVVSSIDNRKENLPIIIISAITTTTIVIYGILGPGAKGSYYNQISVRLRGMFRTARESLVKLNNSDEMLELVNIGMAEMDQMDLNVYSMGLGTVAGRS